MTPEEARAQLREFAVGRYFEETSRAFIVGMARTVDALLDERREALLVMLRAKRWEWCATHETTKHPTAPHGRCTEVDTYMAEVHPNISGDSTEPHWELWAGEPCVLVTVWVVPNE